MNLKSVSSVFWVALAICVIFVGFGAFVPEQTEQVTGDITAFISTYFSWYYLLLIMVILAISVYLLFSRYSSIRLGKEDEDPEFSLPSWFAMLFSAGMGIGLVFWTTAEPISHAFNSAPVSQPGSDQAIEEALQYSFFHWGIHAWAVYAIVALTFAYFNFHKGYPGLVSATLTPLIGEERAQGIFGKMIDILAVIATVTGVAATLGFGAMQINEGLGYLFNIPSNFPVQFAIIAASTVLFTWSAWAGINKGIKRLSNLNMSLAAIVLLALFIIGPTLYILNMFTHSIGNYIANFFEMGLRLPMNDEAQMNWVIDWTIFYWAWWISWAPFVGIFIARVSRGRTIKEFIIGVLAVPSLVMFIFFTVFGASAINLEANGIAQISEYATETATFAMLEQYPFGYLMSLFTVTIVVIFFVTSADSATFVLGMLSTNGNNYPAGFVKVSWGVILSAFAVIMIYTGGVQSIQNMLIVAALPFSVVIILMTWSLFISLNEERPRYKNQGTRRLFVKKQD
ncbi:BCCT family transporter [Salinicoccus halitifaciens]|uniref:Choline/carnitine/betaine transport n=1 Tax=Salinicoccus halitifaciens TaxID=1073415 RepID=A0ABV2E859_9STAP|nr:BCCT family transporter [Salinicoccus halitifaciens]MCD2137742.1 BCCT family transporter [Salinicoccus halitifaciens]